ncbi:MAG: homocysteine S-methyltransferase family protein [Bacteroidaceae bacterium]|nr:homocysteine S-methyltransferase family protein [Bacteroidaceae bacterium]
MDILEALKERILILDGGMGTCIQQAGLKYDGNNDALPMTNPDAIFKIHKAYVEAGADIVSTCSFSANAVSQEGYGMQNRAREMNKAAAKLARCAAITARDRQVWVMGSMGPTSKSLFIAEMMMDPDETLDYDKLMSAYYEQASGLIEGGVDGFLVETVTDARNAQAALSAIDMVQKEFGTNLPIMVSASIMNNSGCLMTGISIKELYDVCEPYGLLSFGLNCSFGAKELYPFIKEISSFAKCAVSVYPNAGMPTANGYEEGPCDTANAISAMARDGLVNIAGGCCGTTPEHIRHVAEALKGMPARKY